MWYERWSARLPKKSLSLAKIFPEIDPPIKPYRLVAVSYQIPTASMLHPKFSRTKPEIIMVRDGVLTKDL